MRKIISALFLLFFIQFSKGQLLRIAILDFDNISGIAKYDGLGKAMSSMLISDIESNVSSKRMQLVERAQINKIMKEQNLQKSASFDKNTAVKMGKLLGVNFLLIGDIYILDNNLVINARLTDASTGDIKFSEKQEGKVNEWLTVKTKLGKGVASSLSMPFTEPRIPDAIVAPAVLTTYASAIDENDKGNYEKAETLINTAKEFNPGFSYFDDLRDEIEKLKKQVAEQGKKIEVLESSGGLIIKPVTLQDFKFNLAHTNASLSEKRNCLLTILSTFASDLTDEDFKYLSGHGIHIKSFYISPISISGVKNINSEIEFIAEIANTNKYDQRVKVAYVIRNLFLAIKSTNFSLMLEAKKSRQDSVIISEIFVTKRSINAVLVDLYNQGILNANEYMSLFAMNASKYIEFIYLQQRVLEYKRASDSIQSVQKTLNPNDAFYGQTIGQIERELERNNTQIKLMTQNINIDFALIKRELCSCFNGFITKSKPNTFSLIKMLLCANEICKNAIITSLIKSQDFIDFKKVVEVEFSSKPIVFDEF